MPGTRDAITWADDIPDKCTVRYLLPMTGHSTRADCGPQGGPHRFRGAWLTAYTCYAFPFRATGGMTGAADHDILTD